MSDDRLEFLRDLQDRERRTGPGSFDEWRQEEIRKARNLGPGYNPGVGMMGPPGNTPSRAPTGPRNRPSGETMVGWSGAGYPMPSGLRGNPSRQPYDKPYYSSEPWFGRQQFGVSTGLANAQPSKYNFDRPDQPSPWIDDVDMQSIWYSPFEPVWPFGPPYYTRPREWNYPVGYNLNFIQPRMELMSTLRGMRGSWGLVSTAVKTVMDQLLRVPWTIQVRGHPRATSKGVDEVRKRLRRPDGKLSFSQWVRKVMDDLLVIDAPTIYIDRSLDGRPRNFEILDGATIFPLIDDAGRRPDADIDIGPDGAIEYIHRQPAYQQIIYGLPMINLSEDEIIYAFQYPRPEMPMFGYGPVEQMLVEVTEGIRKTFYQAEFWRSGSMPELMVTVPDNWTPRHIATFQAHFDALLSGQLSLKSKVRFVPGGMKPFDIKNASGESLWSQRDEFLVRLVCFTFSLSPMYFAKFFNRATANNAAQLAVEEGLYPRMSWLKDDIMDEIIQNKLGYEDIEFSFLPRPDPDNLKQAQIVDLKIKRGEISLDEARDASGLDALPDGLGAKHLIYAGNGAFTLEQLLSGSAAIPGAPAPQASPTSAPIGGPTVAHEKTPEDKGKPPTDSGVKKSLKSQIKREAEEAELNPTKEQKKAGNYPKGHVRLHGLDISIENPKGSTRKGKNPDGTKWKSKMAGHYGYIRGTLGPDGDQLDVCIGQNPKSSSVFVVDQVRAEDGGFDEPKIFLGYKTAKAALKAYLKSNSDGLGAIRAGAITEMSIDELKSWMRNGDTRTPVSTSGFGQRLFKFDTISTGTNLSWYDQNNAVVPRKKKKKRRNSRSAGPRWLELGA